MRKMMSTRPRRPPAIPPIIPPTFVLDADWESEATLVSAGATERDGCEVVVNITVVGGVVRGGGVTY